MGIQLIIKSPTQHIDDFKIECDLEWTIGQVKDEITSIYPSQPKREVQKLIYGGKLLPDNLVLKSILNHTQDVHTLHLVCPLLTKAENSKTTESQNPEAFSTPALNPLYSEINQQFLTPQDLTNNMPPNGPNIPFNPPYPPGDAVYQYMVMQHMYSQFMTQYLSHINNNMGSLPYNYMPLSTQAQSANETEPTPLPENNRNPPPNARQGPRDENDREPDYIDYLYVASRFLVMFAILYYHSSFSRIMMVLSLGICIYMYVRASRQLLTQHQNMPQVNENNSENEQSNVQNETSTPSDIQLPDSNNEDNSELSTVPEFGENHELPSLKEKLIYTISFIYETFSLFFTSLIPTEPVPVNVN